MLANSGKKCALKCLCYLEISRHISLFAQHLVPLLPAGDSISRPSPWGLAQGSRSSSAVGPVQVWGQLPGPGALPGMLSKGNKQEMPLGAPVTIWPPPQLLDRSPLTVDTHSGRKQRSGTVVR